MTTTQDLMQRLDQAPTVAAYVLDLKPGDVLYDPEVLPHTGLGYVVQITHLGLVTEIDVAVVTPDGGDADETVTWHSTLPLSRVPGLTAGMRSGFWANLDHGGNHRHIDGTAELVDALDAVVI